MHEASSTIVRPPITPQQKFLQYSQLLSDKHIFVLFTDWGQLLEAIGLAVSKPIRLYGG